MKEDWVRNLSNRTNTIPVSTITFPEDRKVELRQFVIDAIEKLEIHLSLEWGAIGQEFGDDWFENMSKDIIYFLIDQDVIGPPERNIK